MPRIHDAQPAGLYKDNALRNISPPVIAGAPIVEETLVSSTGTWNGPVVSFGYQWYSGAAQVGEGGNSYSPIFGDTGNNICVAVTAYGVDDFMTAKSLPTDEVIPADLPVTTTLLWDGTNFSGYISNYGGPLGGFTVRVFLDTYLTEIGHAVSASNGHWAIPGGVMSGGDHTAYVTIDNAVGTSITT